jgi:PD-(D/E)XK nuclease superfamily
MNSKIKNLINRATTVSKHYNKISELTGDNYNIFKILKVDTSEVRLHSAFIANLLDIKGNHGQGDTFLKIFTTVLAITNFEPSKAWTRIEEYAGKKTEEDGGRIDIIITSNDRNIIIENKIYAPDQDNQLLRYSKIPNLTLFYLTLYGTEASVRSLGKDGDVKYTPISYTVDIINWLELCKKETVNQPILRETLTQYINLIKLLTNQSTNQQMSKEIIDIVTESKDNIEAFFELSKVNEGVYQKVLKTLDNEIKEIAQELNLESWSDINRSKKYSNFGFYKQEWEALRIQFIFDGTQTKNLYYGFLIDKEFRTKNYEFTVELKQKFIEKFGNKVTDNNNWISFIYWDEYRDWDNKVYLQIYSGDFKQALKAKIVDLLNITKDICMETKLNDI